MGKEFFVDLDVTMSVRMYVNADNEEDAKNKAINKVKLDTLYHLQNGCYVDSVVYDVDLVEE